MQLPGVSEGKERATILRISTQGSLTSTSLVTDETGAESGSTKYLPFGSTRSGSVPTDEQFTGQKLDGTGLYYYNARYYDPTIGRFVSADTVIPSFMNPQSLNRYSYCYNNPLKYTDPTGHWGWIGALIGGVVNAAAYAITHQDNFSWGGLATAAVTGAASGALGNFGAPVAALAGMYSTVVQNIVDKEETTGLDLIAGAAGAFAGNLGGTAAAKYLADDVVEEVGTFSYVFVSSTETSVARSTSMTVVTATISEVTPAIETAAYKIIEGTAGALIGMAVDHGLLSAAVQYDSGSSSSSSSQVSYDYYDDWWEGWW